VYSQDVVFGEVKDVIKHEVKREEPEKIDFELEEESNSTTEEESEDEEPQTPSVLPCNFNRVPIRTPCINTNAT